MAKEHLTNTGIKNKKPGDKDYFITDSSGMQLRVYPSGRKVFCWRYRDARREGKLTRIEYGDYPDRSLDEARQIHIKAKTARSNGADLKVPITLNDIIREVAKNAPELLAATEAVYTVNDLIDDYWSDYIEANNIGQRPYRRIRKHVGPALGHHPADSVPEHEIEGLITRQRESGEKDRTIYDTMRFSSSMYRWGIEQFKCKTNPFKKFIPKNQRRTRTTYYTMTEIRKLLLNENEYPLDRDFYLIQKAFILSGGRRSEVIKAQKQEFCFDTQYWTIPPERVKNQNMKAHDDEKKPFVLPMSRQLTTVFSEAIDKHGNDSHVFGSKRRVKMNGDVILKPTGHSSMRYYHSEISEYREAYGVGGKTNHDLRRTLETNLTNLMVPDYVTTSMTGHGRKGMSKVYNQAQQILVLRAAFQLWADFIDFLCERDESYALAFDRVVPGKELKEIYSHFNYQNRIMDALSIFQPS